MSYPILFGNTASAGAVSGPSQIRALLLMGSSSYTTAQKNTLQTAMIAANTAVGGNPNSTFSVFGYDESIPSHTNYDVVFWGNGNGTQYQANVLDFWNNNKGVVLHIFITGDYQEADVYASFPSAFRISEGVNYTSSYTTGSINISEIGHPTATGLTNIVIGSTGYVPQTLTALNSGIAYGTGPSGSGAFMVASSNASGRRRIDLPYPTYPNSSWLQGSSATDIHKHIVKSLYWVHNIVL